MSEVQVNSVLSSQSADTLDSVKQDANGEPVMTKSKARSLRRKRAKQRKKAMETQEVKEEVESQEVKKEESQNKENHSDPSNQESQTANKKKRNRKKKKKKKTNVVEQPKTDENNSSIAAAQKDTPNVKSEVKKPEAPTPKKISNANTRVAKPSPEIPVSAAVPKDIPNAETKSANSVKECSPEKETSARSVDDSAAIPVETRELPTSVYEDDNDGNGGTSEDCACACVIS